MHRVTASTLRTAPQPSRWSWLAAGLLLALGLGDGIVRAAGARLEDSVIELPKFEVTETRLLPPPETWRYAQIDGFEILSNASDSATQRLIKDFRLFNAALGVVWPALQTRTAVPTPLILCGRDARFDAFVPASARARDNQRGLVSVLVHDAEHAAIALDLQASVLNLDAIDPGGDSTGVKFTGLAVDHRRQLYREYVHYLLARSEPRPAAWLEEGLAQLVMGMKFDRTHIEFAQLEDPNAVSIKQAIAAQWQNNASVFDGNGAMAPLAPGTISRDQLLAAQDATTVGSPDAPVVSAEDRDFNAALVRTRLMPFAAMFAVAHDSPLAQQPVGNAWSKQCHAFVHLCLYGEHKRYQKGFVQFIVRTAHEPISEPLFKDCFSVGYRAMQLALRGYIQSTTYEPLAWSAQGRGFETPPELPLRDATPAEVGRIKGETLALAGQTESARTELIAPYMRGARDPQLLAALGLFDYAAGQSDRARRFLEAAFAANITRPDACVALARVRLDAAMAKLTTSDQRFSPEQAAALLAPLLAAQRQPPLPVGLYELAAEIWLQSAGTPHKDDLALLVDGVRFFPGRVRLVFRTAQLCAKAGLKDSARSLIDHGLTVAPDAATRAPFERLRLSLTDSPATSDSAAK